MEGFYCIVARERSRRGGKFQVLCFRIQINS